MSEMSDSLFLIDDNLYLELTQESKVKPGQQFYEKTVDDDDDDNDDDDDDDDDDIFDRVQSSSIQ